jgi:CPA1 family monovalent cation:H+ antiporter
VSVAVLAAAARAIDALYPIVLVLGGAVMGFIGAAGRPPHPDLVVVLFLPPLLYSAAYFANLRDLRTDLRPISLLAIGLVLFTMVVVVDRAEFVDDLSWPCLLGAIVAPRPVAATAIARRLGVPPARRSSRASLVNDATALGYKIAIAASRRLLLTARRGLGVPLKAAGGIGRPRGGLYVIEIPAARRPAGREHDRAADRVRRVRAGRAPSGCPRCSRR